MCISFFCKYYITFWIKKQDLFLAVYDGIITKKQPPTKEIVFQIKDIGKQIKNMCCSGFLFVVQWAQSGTLPTAIAKKNCKKIAKNFAKTLDK